MRSRDGAVPLEYWVVEDGLLKPFNVKIKAANNTSPCFELAFGFELLLFTARMTRRGCCVTMREIFEAAEEGDVLLLLRIPCLFTRSLIDMGLV